jgi:hypothetical protein
MQFSIYSVTCSCMRLVHVLLYLYLPVCATLLLYLYSLVCTYILLYGTHSYMQFYLYLFMCAIVLVLCM